MWRLPGVSFKQFAKDFRREVKDDNVPNGAAALAYYLMLALFPALIFLLSLLPFLPIANLDQAVMDLLRQALPGEAASLLDDTVREVVGQRSGGLLSFGIIGTLWAASSGVYAVMQQLNITYDVKEGRGFFKARGIALGLTIGFGLLVAAAFSLIVLGGLLQGWLASTFGWGAPLLVAFAALRWIIIFALLLLAFAVVYYFGPDVEQSFRFITPGSLIGVVLLALAALGFRFYVSNFGNYSATYGSLGAVIVLLLWLYIVGLVLLLGSEVNALVEHYKAGGKQKGEKREPRGGRGGPPEKKGPPPQRRQPPPERPVLH
ncbi:MAG: YihY/virulence factor BrkB family protein [Myxococcales bacterium]|jgi:membrane protein